MSDADRPSCQHGDSFTRECSPCRGYRMEAAAAARISTLEARIAELTATSARLDLEIEWFERLIEEDGARGSDVDLYRSLLHKLRQVRGDIPSRAPSHEEMDRFFADALKESNHDLLRKELAAARDRIAEMERELAKPENWPLEALTESNGLRDYIAVMTQRNSDLDDDNQMLGENLDAARTRIAELERERDEAEQFWRARCDQLGQHRDALQKRLGVGFLGDDGRDAKSIAAAARRDLAADLDEAVRLLECVRKVSMLNDRLAESVLDDAIYAYLALHPAQPEDCRGECERGKCASCWPETPTKGPR